MVTSGKEWSQLQKREQISALEKAKFETQMKWLRINLLAEKEQSTGLGAGRL